MTELGWAHCRTNTPINRQLGLLELEWAHCNYGYTGASNWQLLIVLLQAEQAKQKRKARIQLSTSQKTTRLWQYK